MTSEILLIEDHKDIAAMVSKHLEGEGFVIDYADNGLLGLKLGLSNEYDAIVLDLTLPGLDGIEVCEKLRVENKTDTPILMLTARDTLEDKLQGFDSGADDYLLKPFELEELSARLRALLRRNNGSSSQNDLKVADLILCRQTEVVTRRGIELNLTPTGKKILALLMREAPNVVSRKRLEKEIWGDMPPDSDALRSHLYTLRKIVDKPFDYALIHTVQSSGFRMSVDDDC